MVESTNEMMNSGGDANAELISSGMEPELPGYLRDGSAPTRSYGILSYNRKTKCWMIRGEPCVIELAKRLFPGCDGRGRGVARFAAHRRIIGELNWLMLRYPLTIKDRDAARWQSALEEARDYAIRREAAYPLVTETPPMFRGELMPFQKRGLGFLLQNTRALLADEMGLGKTVQALAFLSAAGAYPALIVVPPHLIYNWKREAERFVTLDGEKPVRIHIIKGLTPAELPPADIYIIHYLLLRGWKSALPDFGFDAVIFDEIQELRHSGTEKYSAASLLASACDKVVGLSGTPIYNQGGEIWNVVNILDFHFLGDYESFSREWCSGYGNQTVLKPELLGEHLKSEGLMLRRRKEEVLTELPPKRRLVQEVEADMPIFRELMKAAQEKLSLLEDETLDAGKRALIEDQISQAERQATGVAKAPYVSAFVHALCESGEKVLLFAHHHKAMDIYKKQLSAHHPVFITGRESQDEKDRAARAFMEGETDLCVISLRAAAGLNLQRASCVVFGELDWSPAVHSQAEDRAHRIGQADSLLCYYLVCPYGSDSDMQDAIGLKVSQFVSLMGDRPATQEETLNMEQAARSHIKRVISRLGYQSLTGASTGHTSAQAPHSMH